MCLLRMKSWPGISFLTRKPSPTSSRCGDRLMVSTEPRTLNLELRTSKSRDKPPKATSKPYTRHILGIDSGVHRHLKATPRPHQSHTKATPKPPTCDPQGTSKPGNPPPHASRFTFRVFPKGKQWSRVSRLSLAFAGHSTAFRGNTLPCRRTSRRDCGRRTRCRCGLRRARTCDRAAIWPGNRPVGVGRGAPRARGQACRRYVGRSSGRCCACRLGRIRWL